MAKKLPNVHPGEVLLEEFLEPLEISNARETIGILIRSVWDLRGECSTHVKATGLEPR